MVLSHTSSSSCPALATGNRLGTLVPWVQVLQEAVLARSPHPALPLTLCPNPPLALSPPPPRDVSPLPLQPLPPADQAPFWSHTGLCHAEQYVPHPPGVQSGGTLVT